MGVLMDAAKRSDGPIVINATPHQVEAMRLALIEACHGMWIDNFSETLGFEKSAGTHLLDNFDMVELGEDQARVTATPAEVRMFVNSMKETLKRIGYHGYVSRVGAYPDEVREMLAVLEPILQGSERG